MKEVSIAEGYTRLAIAIIKTGIMENDVSFLKSEWCNFLITLVKTYCEAYPTTIQVYDLQNIYKYINSLNTEEVKNV